MKKPFGLLASACLAPGIFLFPFGAAAQIADTGFAGTCEMSATVAPGGISGFGTCIGTVEGSPGTYSATLGGYAVMPIDLDLPGCGLPISRAYVSLDVGGQSYWHWNSLLVSYPGQAFLALNGEEDVGIAIFDPATASAFGSCGTTGTLRLSFGPNGTEVYTRENIYEPISGIVVSVPPTPVQTPRVSSITVGSTPSIPSITVNTPEVPSIDAETPAVPSVKVGTPAMALPQVCTPANIVCVGSFYIPEQYVTTTPAVPSQPITTTPGLAPQSVGTPYVPSQTVATPYVPSQTVVTPEIGPIPLTPDISLRVVVDNFTYAYLYPNIGALSAFGPITVEVPTPIGPLPVTVCGSTCPVLLSPDAAMHFGVTVTLQIGSETFTQRVPITYPATP